MRLSLARDDLRFVIADCALVSVVCLSRFFVMIMYTLKTFLLSFGGQVYTQSTTFASNICNALQLTQLNTKHHSGMAINNALHLAQLSTKQVHHLCQDLTQCTAAHAIIHKASASFLSD